MEMGEDCARYLEVIDDQHEEVVASRQQLASCQTPACNTGKRINEFHPLKESKLATFRNLSIQALWFGESFGLFLSPCKYTKKYVKASCKGMQTLH